MITNLKIHNFKSLRNVELHDMPSLLVMVGANASGKSNFVKALDFLFQVMTNGLTNAVDNYGGYEGICFRKERRSKGAIKFGFKLEVELPEIWGENIKIGDPSINLIYEYEFSFQATKQSIDAPYKVLSETLNIDLVCKEKKIDKLFQFVRLHDEIKKYEFKEGITEQEGFWQIPEMPPKDHFIGQGVSPTTLAMAKGTFGTIIGMYYYFTNSKGYFITPEEIRRPVSDTSSAGTILNKYGNNLASVIKYFRIEKPEIYENLIEHLQVAAPTILSVNSQYTDSKQLSYNLKEKGFGRPWHPKEVSDGTLETLGLFIPLEDTRIPLAAYDEPENSVHPWIQEHFAKTCLEKCDTKQIVLSTHSPIIVDEAPPESLYIIIKNEKGETVIQRANKEHPQIKKIVEKNIMPLGDYWKSGAVGGVPRQILLDFKNKEV